MKWQVHGVAVACVLFVITWPGAVVRAGDWPAWRGPHGNNLAAEGQTPPTTWDESTHIVWKAPVPGRGNSSPIVVGQRVLLSTADDSDQVQSIICFDRATGRQLWQTAINRGGFNERIHKKNTHATPTLACDGQRVFAVFNNHDGVQLAALDLDGKVLWKTVAGGYVPKQYKYGYAPSPAIYKSTVIVTSEYEADGFLAAYNTADGSLVWRTARPREISYSSPIVAPLAGGDQLLLSGCSRVSSFDPGSGKPLWSVPGMWNVTCGTMVWQGDLVFASGGYPKSGTMAVRADGSGQLVWKNNVRCYEQSMLAHQGHVYAVSDAGVAYCWKADDGLELWSQRLRGPISSSPVLAGGNVYVSTERGTTFVFAADPAQFKLIAQNQLGDEAFATPAICDNRIYHRAASSASGQRRETLYCIGR